MNVAVVTLVQGRAGHLRLQAGSLMSGSRAPDRYVVVAMDDPGASSCLPDMSLQPLVVDLPVEGPGLPLARARNVGVRQAVDDGAHVVIVLDVDCLAGPDLVAGYVEAVEAAPETIWSGPVTYLPPPPPGGYDVSQLPEQDDPHPARPAPPPGALAPGADPDLFWSLSFALTAQTWLRTGGFCEEYSGYGGEDTDFARLAVSRGVGFGWSGTPRAYHQYHPTADPPVQHVTSILRNATLFHRRWGTWPMGGWLEEFQRLGLIQPTAGGWEVAGGATEPGSAAHHHDTCS